MKEEQKYNGSKTRNYFTAYLLASIRGKRLRYMLYGHVHDTQDQRLLERFQGITSETTFLNTQGETQHIPCNMINCFCMYSNYQPLTLDEWIACDKNRKQKSCQNVK